MLSPAASLGFYSRNKDFFLINQNCSSRCFCFPAKVTLSCRNRYHLIHFSHLDAVKKNLIYTFLKLGQISIVSHFAHKVRISTFISQFFKFLQTKFPLNATTFLILDFQSSQSKGLATCLTTTSPTSNFLGPNLLYPTLVSVPETLYSLEKAITSHIFTIVLFYTWH